MPKNGNVRFIRVRGRVVPIRGGHSAPISGRERVARASINAISNGFVAAGTGALFSDYGQNKLLNLKILRPIKNPFRSFKVADKAAALQKVQVARRFISAGNFLKSVGVLTAGVGAVGVAGLLLTKPFAGSKKRGRR